MSKKWRTQVGEVNVLSGQVAIIDPISLEGNLDEVTEVIKDLDKIFPVTISTGTLLDLARSLLSLRPFCGFPTSTGSAAPGTAILLCSQS